MKVFIIQPTKDIEESVIFYYQDQVLKGLANTEFDKYGQEEIDILNNYLSDKLASEGGSLEVLNYVYRSIEELFKADLVICLPRFYKSKMCELEYLIASHCKMKIIYARDNGDIAKDLTD